MKIISWFLRLISPGYSWCHICGRPWNWCKAKSVMFTDGKGGFATCTKCWKHSTLEEVKAAYIDAYFKHWKTAGDSLPHILKCVEQEYNKTHK